VSNENNDDLRWEPKSIPPRPQRKLQLAAFIALALAVLVIFAVIILHPHVVKLP
jgi:hypothetical protein